MVKAGFTPDEIATVLTDPANWLGEAAYDHAKTKSRARAAEWVKRYTEAKGRREGLDEAAFSEAVVETVLEDTEVAKQLAELVGPEAGGGWERLMDRSAGEDAKPKCTLKNVLLILREGVGEGGEAVFRRNLFHGVEEYGMECPWGGKAGAEVRDVDLILMKVWLAHQFRLEPSVNLLNEAVLTIAKENEYHPVRDYLWGLEWDGRSRLDKWLAKYMGASGPPAYLEAVSRKTLTAMVARVMEPGIKWDYMLIMEGKQGCGKSTAVRILAHPWFSDSHIIIGDKDAVVNLRGIWCLEMGELAGMKKADSDMLKAFISQGSDRIRVPYGHRAEDFPRQNIFIGTSNNEEGDYIRDQTGGRRFWPVHVRQCRFEELARDRDQLMAEARVAWEFGEALYLDGGDAAREAVEEQELRTEQDGIVEEISKGMRDKNLKFNSERFSIMDLFSDFGPLSKMSSDMGNQRRAAEALRKLGYRKIRSRNGNERIKLWALKMDQERGPFSPYGGPTGALVEKKKAIES
jgi:putative DNA primase/helicase